MKQFPFTDWSLKIPQSVIYPTEQFIHYLRVNPCCEVYELTEHFVPERLSVHLPNQRSALLEQKSFTTQYLVKAYPSLGVYSDSGLLRCSNNKLMYEFNQENRDEVKSGDVSLAKACFKSFISGINSKKTPEFTLPPGWYAASRGKNVYRKRITHITTHNNPNYFHWFTMPGQSSLFLEDFFLDKHERSGPVVVTHSPRSQLPDFARSILNITTPQRNIHCIKSGLSLIGCNFSLQRHRTPVAISPKLTHWLSHKVKMLLDDQIHPKELVYISRGKSKKRACINELEIYAALAPLGFQMRCLDSLTVQDQLSLFRQAACIISPHGAALTNLIACYPKTTVIELIPGYGDFSHYYLISDLLGLQHGHVIGRCIGDKTDSFYVNPLDVLAILNQLSIY